MTTELTAEALNNAINAAWRRMINFPYPQISKHYTVMILMEELEKRGADMPTEFVNAVVSADDETALQFQDYRRLPMKED